MQDALSQAKKEVPRLSATIAKILLERSPLHAWQAHRLLGGGVEKETTEAKETGKILESYILDHKKDTLVILDFKDFRTNAAKEAKDIALAEGKTIILKDDEKPFVEVATAIKKNLSQRGIDFNGKSGIRIEWESDGVNCSGELDHFILGRGMILDLKCVTDASNKALQKAMVDHGWDIQGAAYLDWMRTEHPVLAGRGTMGFAFCEKKPPYAVNPKVMRGAMLELGESKWNRAKRVWKKCMATGIWPGYADDDLEPAQWAMTQEFEKTMMEQVASEMSPQPEE